MTSVKFIGLDDYIAGLREYERDIKRATAEANREVAEYVVPFMRAKFAEVRPKKAVRRAGYIKARGTQRKAAVAVQLTRWPDFYGDEFGGRRRRTTQQFLPYRLAPGGRGGAGYFIYPTLRERTAEITEFYAEAHTRALKRAFPR